jgi:hypothetical protein
MARTFTGLKLQGSLGKFGKKEISDIEGFLELPSSKVVSGSEWGNLLLWDGGVCKAEISRKGNKTCHNGSIQQILIDVDDIITIGIDGFVRVCSDYCTSVLNGLKFRLTLQIFCKVV